MAEGIDIILGVRHLDRMGSRRARYMGQARGLVKTLILHEAHGWAGGWVEKRIVAGLLIVIAFTSSFVESILLFILWSTASPWFAGYYLFSGILTVYFCLMALIGAFYALSGKSWRLALVGSVFAILSTGILYSSVVLGIAALVLIAISHKEFMDKRANANRYLAAARTARPQDIDRPGRPMVRDDYRAGVIRPRPPSRGR